MIIILILYMYNIKIYWDRLENTQSKIIIIIVMINYYISGNKYFCNNFRCIKFDIVMVLFTYFRSY